MAKGIGENQWGEGMARIGLDWIIEFRLQAKHWGSKGHSALEVKSRQRKGIARMKKVDEQRESRRIIVTAARGQRDAAKTLK